MSSVSIIRWDVFVFSHRFITILLLLVYGVPAAIGPHWHHHDRSCNHENAICGSTNTATGCQSEAVDRDGKTSDSSSGDRCCCHHRSPYRSGTHPEESRSKSNHGGGWSSVADDCGLCSICIHQAQSSIAAATIAITGLEDRIGTVDFRTDSPVRSFVATLHARGPPAAFLCS
ncbi:MAG: hypothetical protein MUD03_12235 [Pirellula sp.]|nr:hypothetical protein [Pirellula sp.]